MYASRRDRRRAARKIQVGAQAASAGRATAAVMAASGLVLTSGVAANAAEDSGEGRESATVQLNAAELNVERVSNSVEADAAVTAARDSELSFDRPVVTSQRAAGSVEVEEVEEDAPAADETVADTPADAEAESAVQAQAERDAAAEAEAETQAAAEQAEQQAQADREAQAAAEAEAQAEREAAAEAEQAQEAQQAQPAQQTQQSETSNGASTAGESDSGSAPSSAGSSSIVAAAYSTLGTPHVMGGTTPGSGIDCSGMIQFAYAQAGISVPRTTYGMMGLPQVSSPQPGDIVIANGGGHGAIYIGNGQVISTTASQGVRVHGLHEGWHNVNSYHRPG